MMITKRYLMMMIVLLTAAVAKAQTPADDAKYTEVITQRSDKIITTIGVTDSAKFKKVRAVMVDQYRFINDTHNKRNADVKAVKDAGGDDKTAKIAAIDSSLQQQLNKQHTVFLFKLGKELSADQVEKVKDEMTYKKVAVTYNAYLDELPQLTEPQKAQLKAWLVEAREKAIDAGSSDEKSAIFGKYKGRINNYLSKEGYDMKQAGIDWQKRLADRKAAKTQ